MIITIIIIILVAIIAFGMFFYTNIKKKIVQALELIKPNINTIISPMSIQEINDMISLKINLLRELIPRINNSLYSTNESKIYKMYNTICPKKTTVNLNKQVTKYILEYLFSFWNQDLSDDLKMKIKLTKIKIDKNDKQLVQLLLFMELDKNFYDDMVNFFQNTDLELEYPNWDNVNDPLSNQTITPIMSNKDIIQFLDIIYYKIITIIKLG